jgi:hypothetical protein
MSELYSNDPLITWAAVWVAARETAPCKICRRRRALVLAARGHMLAGGLALDAYIAYRFGWV